MYRILVCDGEKEIVSHLSVCLTAEGYQVVTARTGWEVLNILSKQHIPSGPARHEAAGAGRSYHRHPAAADA